MCNNYITLSVVFSGMKLGISL